MKGAKKMKKMMLICAVALATVSAMAQGRALWSDKTTDPSELRKKASAICSMVEELATIETCKKFGIVIAATEWTNNCEKSLLIVPSVYCNICKYDRGGNLVQVGKQEDFEELRWRKKRIAEIQEELWKFLSVVDPAVLDVAKDRAGTSRRRVSDNDLSLQGNGLDDLPRLERLEELIPLEDALALAKDGKGKGYFQLALHYANGLELPSEPRTAYMMLRKAVDANYANAILVDGLLEEEDLYTALENSSRGKAGWKNDGKSVHEALRKYCGDDVRFETDGCSLSVDSLTNKVAVTHVMSKYEKAKEMGAWTATNQIAALNKRITDFEQTLADYKQALADCAEKEAKQRAANEKRMAEQKTAWDKQRAELDRRRVIAKKNDKELENLLTEDFQTEDCQVAFREMFGYEMGEEIAHVAGDVVERDGNRYRWLKLRKPYRDFQWLRIDCMNDHLWSAGMRFEPKDKSASAVLAQTASSVKDDLEQRYGIAFKRKGKDCWEASDYGWVFSVELKDGCISVWVKDKSYRSTLIKDAEENSKRQKEIVLPTNVTVGAWTDNFDAAKMLSKEKNLPIMLNFTGSDWCGWCKRMDEKVFKQKAWKAWAKKNLVCVTVDFPSDRRMVSPSVRDRNWKLDKRFGIDSNPTFVLLSPGGDKEIGRVDGGKHATPQEFINRLQEAQKKAKAEKAARTQRTTDLVRSGKAYCVIDLSSGADAETYPATYLDRAPKGGFNAPEYKTTKLVLKRVDAGSFIMGDKQNDETRRVTLTKPFYMGLFEVTQKQWDLVMGEHPSKVKGEEDPVCNVCYDMIRGSHEGSEWPTSNAVDAGSFLGRLRAKAGLDFDLPTEAQWEYTCRAGTKTRFSHGDNEDSAYYADDQRGALEGRQRRRKGWLEVGTRKPNPWGFYDMHGNVWEWCLDKWEQPTASARGVWSRGARSRGTIQPAPPIKSYRVLRGGSYDNEAGRCTSFSRGYNDPSGSDLDYCHGFRLSIHDDAKK